MFGLLSACRSSDTSQEDDDISSVSEGSSEEDSSGDENSNTFSINEESVIEDAASDHTQEAEENASKDHQLYNQRYGIGIDRVMLLTIEDITFFGLSYAGFDEKRQNVRESLIIDRFKAFYGPEPRTVKDLLLDLKEKYPNIIYREVMMTLNWLKLYDIEHVLAGRWKFGEDYISRQVKANAKRIQSLKSKVIRFELKDFGEHEIHLLSLDTVNFLAQEFRLDPSTIWYDQKSHSSGLKYQFALALRRSLLVDMQGPIPAGAQGDRAMFCGGKLEDSRESWDKSSLYNRLPKGKKVIADSAYSLIPEKATITLNKHSKKVKQFINRAKARQESYHWRLKSYQVLGGRFRHGRSTEDKMAMHKMCTEAVCVIVQYDLKYHPLMQMSGKVKED